MELSGKHCVPCEGGTLPLTGEILAAYAKNAPGWKVAGAPESAKAPADKKKISREFKFKDFKAAMVFVNRVAEIANQEEHHPDICIFYNLVRLELWTHAIGGLSENDFIMAAKIDELGKG